MCTRGCTDCFVRGMAICIFRQATSRWVLLFLIDSFAYCVAGAVSIFCASLTCVYAIVWFLCPNIESELGKLLRAASFIVLHVSLETGVSLLFIASFFLNYLAVDTAPSIAGFQFLRPPSVLFVFIRVVHILCTYDAI